MRAEIKAYELRDNDDLSSCEPEDKQVFGFTLLFSIGAKGQVGADYFEVDVASAGYLEHLRPQPFFLQHTILANDYNVPEAVALVRKHVEALDGDSWEELASKISRFARWEFEGYRA